MTRFSAPTGPGADDPGLAYSVVAALEPGRTSWTAVLDAVRLGPQGHVAVVLGRRSPARRSGPVLAGVLAPVRLEHTFRLFKQILGWTAPKIRDPQAANRWTWLIITAHTQLRLARPLADDLRLPWERPAPPGRLTPARVRRGFRNICAALPRLAGAPKPGKPGPGKPPGSRNRYPAPRHDVGKTTRRERSLKAKRERAS